MAHTTPTTRRAPSAARSIRHTALGALLVAAACVASAPAAAQPTQAERFEAAMQAYDVQHFDAAYAALSTLADEGHGPAARVAWLMARHGASLYGQARSLDAARSARWLDAAADRAAARPAATLAAGNPP